MLTIVLNARIWDCVTDQQDCVRVVRDSQGRRVRDKYVPEVCERDKLRIIFTKLSFIILQYSLLIITIYYLCDQQLYTLMIYIPLSNDN